MNVGESTRDLILMTRYGAARARIVDDALVALTFGVEQSPSDDPLAKELALAVDTPGAPCPLPLRPAGTDFQQRVWKELLAIPCGETRSYADIAAALGQPGAERAVGSANGANPIAIFIPCHRVVRADGALGGYAGGLAMKRALLEAEGAFVVTRQPTLDF